MSVCVCALYAVQCICAFQWRLCDSGVWVLKPEKWAEKEEQQHDKESVRGRDPLPTPSSPPLALGELQQLQHVQSTAPYRYTHCTRLVFTAPPWWVRAAGRSICILQGNFIFFYNPNIAPLLRVSEQSAFLWPPGRLLFLQQLQSHSQTICPVCS